MTKTCPVCGKEFVVTRGRRYCSKACQRNAHRVTEKACPICGAMFPVSRGRKYCSKDCAALANKENRAIHNVKAALVKEVEREARQAFHAERDKAYEALGVRVTRSVVNGRTVEWRGQRVCGMNSTWGRARY